MTEAAAVAWRPGGAVLANGGADGCCIVPVSGAVAGVLKGGPQLGGCRMFPGHVCMYVSLPPNARQRIQVDGLVASTWPKCGTGTQHKRRVQLKRYPSAAAVLPSEVEHCAMQ